MTTIYFVRHAQPDLAVHDDLTRPLSVHGLQQCAAVTQFLAARRVDKIFSSPYKRALDTVLPFAQQAGLPVVQTYAFRERSVGAWVEDFDAYARRQWTDFDYALPGGESLRDTQQRCIAALQNLLQACPGQTLVIGGHGTAICTVIHYYRPEFTYSGFAALRPLMPHIVQMDFTGQTCTAVTHHRLTCGE